MYSQYEKLMLNTIYGDICEETREQLIEGFRTAHEILNWIEEESHG